MCNKEKMLHSAIYTISKISLIIGNIINRWIFSDFMWGMFCISNSPFFNTILHRHQSINTSSFYNVLFHNVCRFYIVAYTLQNEHKELDYDSRSSFFDVLVMWRFFTFHKRKRRPFDFRNRFLLYNWIRLFMGYIYWLLVSVRQMWKKNYFLLIHSNSGAGIYLPRFSQFLVTGC